MSQELVGSTLFQPTHYVDKSTIEVFSPQKATIYVAVYEPRDGGLMAVLPSQGWTLRVGWFVKWKAGQGLQKIWSKQIDAGKTISFTTSKNRMTFAIFISEDCSGSNIIDVTKDGFKFSTPGYPGRRYLDNQEYSWRFRTSKKAEKLLISFLSIDTEFGYDIITIYEDKASENKGKVLLTASGDKTPKDVISQTNEIRFVFKTDVDNHMTGFKASVMAVKKKDLPHFSWTFFSSGKVDITFPQESSNSHTETIKVNLASNYEGSCVFHGSTEKTNLTIALPYSNNNCKSLSQQIQISLSSVFLAQTQDGQMKRATFAIKNGILQETTDEIFTDNTYTYININPPLTRKQQQHDISHIEIKINLAYDRSILDKFKMYGSGDSEIKKQLRQLFFFAKAHLEDLPGKTRIELILEKDIILINEIFKINHTSLNNLRKYQKNNNAPLILICGDFDEYNPDFTEANYVTGLAYRSGACRDDEERYGVALVAWREDLAVAGNAMAHEIEHLFGMTHNGHTHHDVANWYSKQGKRCYTEYCPSPPTRENGAWKCTGYNKVCHLICSPGFVTAFPTIHCENGQFSSNLEKTACSPTVFLLTGGRRYDGRHMEVYHSTDATNENIACSNLPPPLERIWNYHGSIFLDGLLFLCGGVHTEYICSSLDLEADNPQWIIHRIPRINHATALISSNTLYLFDAWYNDLHMTTWPLQEISQFTKDKLFYYRSIRLYCVAQLDDENVAVLGGEDTVSSFPTAKKYNLKLQTMSDLPAMNVARKAHACVKVNINGRPWLVVSGGSNEVSGAIATTERLNLDENKIWETMNDLKTGRYLHQMIWTEKNTIVVLGGKYGPYYSDGQYLNSIERLNWESKSWELLEQSLVKPKAYFSVVEVPASLLGCQMNDQQICLDPPHIDHGAWSCDGGKTKCGLICDPGYVSTLTHTTCNGGIWSKVDRIQCRPSVWLTIGTGIRDQIEQQSHSFYHPAVGLPTCSKPPPDTVDNWHAQKTFVYNNRLYNCGGQHTSTICVSLNLEDDEFKWTRHQMDISINGRQNVILENKLYIFPNQYLTEPMSTILPLAEKPTFNKEPNIKQLRGDCTIKLNEYSFVMISKHGDVTKYNTKEQKITQLSNLDPPGYQVACIMVNESGIPWLVASGGKIHGEYYGGWKRLQRTDRLDLSNDTATWEALGPLNDARMQHSMINTEMGIVAMGGSTKKTVEIFNWTSQTWSYKRPWLTGNVWSNEYVEVPASAFGCQTIPINITGCHGEYSYNQEYPEGDVKEVSDGETCHSFCAKEVGCQAWTWNEDDQQCRLHATIGTIQSKTNSVSGLKESCKPKCYLLLENQNAIVSTQLCSKTASSIRVASGQRLSYLSSERNGHVHLKEHMDDYYGHQKWIFKHLFDDVYNIIVSGGTDPGEKFLSCRADGFVDLWTHDGGDRQKWRIQEIGSNTYNIKVFGGTNPGKEFLSCTEDGLVDLYSHEGIRQRWKLNLESEERCQPLIQIAPDELQEDSRIFICYIVDGDSKCKEIAYSDVELLCNAEPSIVTLNTVKRINKYLYTIHNGPYFGYN